MASLVSKLQEIAPQYSYRGLEWVTRLGPPITFPSQRTIVFDNFYSKEGQAYTGVCNELMVQAFLDIGRGHNQFGRLAAEGRLFRVLGADPVYFSQPPTHLVDPDGRLIQEVARRKKGIHYFLAITDKRVLDNGRRLSGEDAKAALLDGNAVLFDPSFRTVEPLKESNYTIDEIFALGFKLPFQTQAAIFENHTVGSPQQIVGISGGLILSMIAYYPHQDTSRGYDIGLTFMSPGTWSNTVTSLYDRSLNYAAKQVKGLDVFLSHMRGITQRCIRGDDLSKYRISFSSW